MKYSPCLSVIRQWAPGVLPVLMLSVAVYVLHTGLHGIQFSEVSVHLASIGAGHLIAAILLTGTSYLLLTSYDFLALKHVQFPLEWKQIAPTSFNAFAVGHNVGFAALSGGAIRYRAYSAAGLDAPRIAEVVVFCSATFFLGASLLLGLTLVSEPLQVLQTFPLHPNIMRALGWLLVSIPLSYILWSVRSGASVRWSNWRLSLPTWKLAVCQVLVGCLDLTVAALTLYVLMPTELQYSFWLFLGIYLLCLAVAIVSTVPGGVGVFEGGIMLLLPMVPKPELLGSLLVFRLIYYLIPFVLALVLLAVQLGLKRSKQISHGASQSLLILTRAAPQLICGAVFVTGAGLLFSNSLPGDTERIHYISELLPESLVQVSHLLSSVIGLALLILARGLFRRLEGAFWIALVALALGMLVSLLKGFDYPQAIFLCLVAALLWAGRFEFYRKASLLEEPFTGGWFLSIVMVVGAATWLGLFSYRHVEYNNALWWNFAIDRDAPKMLRASFTVVVLLLAFGIFKLLKTSSRLSIPATNTDLARVSTIIRLGSSALANVALSGDKRFLFHPSNEAFIMYQLVGKSAISMGDPVGNAAHFSSLTWSFRELCDKLDKRCVFYQVSKNNLPHYIDLGLGFLKLGEEAIIPMAEFSLEGSKRAEFRQARNRAFRDGASFEIVPANQVADILGQLRAVSDNWLAHKHAKEKGFSIGMFDEHYLTQSDIAIVTVNEKIVAFANLWCAGDRTELSVDLMRHTEDAPKGIMDYLFTELLLWGKENGYQYFNLGMAPLSGLASHSLATLWNKLGTLIYRHADEFYNFEGIRNYKQKYDPQWEPRYLAAPGGRALPGVLIDATTLISGGITGVFVR